MNYEIREESTSDSAKAEIASVSEWVKRLNDGDQAVVQQLWDRYFDKLIAHAAMRVRRYNCPEGTIVPEDIAASVFESIWRGAKEGRFQKVTDRDELWWLLQAMTGRKVVDHIRHATAQRRFPVESQVRLFEGESGEIYRELVSVEPSAEYMAMLKEGYENLLSLLRDDILQRIAVLKIRGYTNDEIRSELNISSATMTRKLKLIRDTWRQALTDQGSEDGNQ